MHTNRILKELIEQQGAEHGSKLEARLMGNHQATWGQVEIGRFSNFDFDILGIFTSRIHISNMWPEWS